MIVLIASLKWTAEFTNHVAASSWAAGRLGLNDAIEPNPSANEAEGPRWWLPYGEFRGYLALPLRFPLVFNVGPITTIAQSTGLAVATGLSLHAIVGTWSILAGSRHRGVGLDGLRELLKPQIPIRDREQTLGESITCVIAQSRARRRWSSKRPGWNRVKANQLPVDRTFTRDPWPNLS